jgi:Rps23 Pro-64 3,4-dihydroxylase Tpa1-like proline 4-hydroxylase
MAGLATRYLVIDDFLGAAAAYRLLAQILASAERFTPSNVRQQGSATVNSAHRSSLRLPGRVGVELDPFKAAVHARFAELCAATGTAPFAVYHTECSVVAHGDGDFYKPHIDTRTGDPATQGKHVRLLSCVYYLNREPPAFSGGELVLHKLGSSDPAATIAPRHDRLAVFPAFIPHEVLPIACPSGAFADSRFSINCWLHRAVGQ